MNRRAIIVGCLFAACGAATSVAAPAAATAPGRIVVIGATAKSAKEIIRQALAAGYEVTAVTRRPA